MTENLSSETLKGFFQARNDALLSNIRQRPSTRNLQARNKQEDITDTKPFQLQKNLALETPAEKKFHMKWHQISYTQKIGKKRQSELTNFMGSLSDDQSSFQNRIESLIEEQEGLVVSSASEKLMEKYHKKDWNHVVVQSQNRSEYHPYESNPKSINFFHADDLEKQRSELKFWEEKVRWLTDRIQNKSQTQTEPSISKADLEYVWGAFPGIIDSSLEIERTSKKQLREWELAQEDRVNRENMTLEKLLQIAEHHVDSLRDEIKESNKYMEKSSTKENLNNSTQSDQSEVSDQVVGGQLSSVVGDEQSSILSLSPGIEKLSGSGTPTGRSPQAPNLVSQNAKPIISSSLTQKTYQNLEDLSSQSESDDDKDYDSRSPNSNKPKRGRPKKQKFSMALHSAQEVSLNDIDSTIYDEEDIIPDIKNSVVESGDFLHGILWKNPEKPEEELRDFPFTKLLIDARDRNLNLVQVLNKFTKLRSAIGNQELESSELDIFMKTLRARKGEGPKGDLLTRFKIQHSGPAVRLDPLYYPTQMSDVEYMNYYHNELVRLPTNRRLPIIWRPTKKAKRKKSPKAQENLKKKIESRTVLSAHKRRSIIIESVERYPMIMNKIGMGNLIVNYHHHSRFDKLQLENIPDGNLRFVENSEELQLLTELDEKHGVISLENENYKAQLFPHKVPSTDFLLTTRNRGSRVEGFQIRRLDASYTMGHTQPLKVVLSASGREVDSYKSNRILQFIKSKFEENFQKSGVSYIEKKDVEAAFQQKHLIREQLKAHAISIGSGKYEMKPDEMLAETLIKPEAVASYDMMRADEVRLMNMGINQENQKIAFGTAFDLSQNMSAPDKIDQDTIRRMSYVILDASWRKTAEYHNLISASAERNFSLLEVSRVSFDSEKLKKLSEECRRLAHEELDRLKNESITITDETAKRILRDQGKLSDAEIESMSRMERKDKARQITESYGKSESRKKQYLQILCEKKKEVMRNIFKVEGEKLRKGRPLYEFIETQHAVMDEYDEDDERSETSMQDDISEDHIQDEEEEEEYMDDETELNNQIRDMAANEEFSAENPSELEKISQPSLSNGYRVVRTLVKRKIENSRIVGTETIKQYITDPDLVEQYRRRDALRSKLAKNKKQAYEYTKEDKHMADIFITGKKEHRRLREQYKRWHKRIKSNNEDPRYKNYQGSEQINTSRKRKVKNQSQGSGKVKRRRKVSIPAANQYIRKIVGSFVKSNKYKVFKDPVDAALYPDYYQCIQKPITLNDIHDKAKNEKYVDIPSFVADIDLLESNCRHYCGEIHPEHNALISLVEQLTTGMKENLEKKREDIERAFHGQALDAPKE